MKSFDFKKLDAFVSGTSSGNPAGYINLDNKNDITDSQMQQIAFELKNFVSEVAFVSPSDEPEIDFNFRYFSCEREVAFCGHATVAICYDITKNDLTISRKPFFNIMTSKGTIQITNNLEAEDLVYIQAPSPLFIDSSIAIDDISTALNINANEIDTTNAISIVNAGLDTLLVPLSHNNTCISCAPDYQTLRNFALRNEIDIINIYTSKTFKKDYNYRTRVFAPTFGYLEDPATGSGNAALGYYLLKHNLWDKDKLIIEQGANKENPNRIVLRKTESNNILIGGNGITRIRGEYLLF